jgi:hypothetical protein
VQELGLTEEMLMGETGEEARLAEAKIADVVGRGFRRAKGMLREGNDKERTIGALAIERIGGREGLQWLEAALERETNPDAAIVMGAALERMRMKAKCWHVPKLEESFKPKKRRTCEARARSPGRVRG